jgi:hypothetical protein
MFCGVSYNTVFQAVFPNFDVERSNGPRSCTKATAAAESSQPNGPCRPGEAVLTDIPS